VLCSAPNAARAATLHPAVTLRAPYVAFYAGHLVLDGNGGAYLDDGTFHVSARRIVVDLRADRYVAAGDVSVCSIACARGAAFGGNLDAHDGLLVSIGNGASKVWLHRPGDAADGRPNATAPGVDAGDPLSLPDTEGEAAFALATGAVAHLGADVRLQDAHVLVPGSRTFFFPSYVYAFSSDPGYVLTNVPGANEDIPVYVGSTRDSIFGLHFLYNQVTKVALGVDEHFVDGQKAYALISAAPIFGPDKVANFTWQENINDHAAQTFTASAAQGFGIFNQYDVRDAVHRSYFELSANQFHNTYQAVLGWQSFAQQLSPSGAGADLYYYLRSEYGVTYNPLVFPAFPLPPDVLLPSRVVHGAVEGYLATRPLSIDSNTTLNLSVDDRYLRDSLPHTQSAQVYSANLQRRWSPHFTTGFSESFAPVHDLYPTLGLGGFTQFNAQTLSANYANRDALGLLVFATHASAATNNPAGVFVQPWFLSADVRFRVNRSLALDLSRSYNFNYLGRTWSGFGVQILP